MYSALKFIGFRREANMIHWRFLILLFLLGLEFPASAADENNSANLSDLTQRITSLELHPPKQDDCTSRESMILPNHACDCKKLIRPSGIALRSPCGNIYVRFCDLECPNHPPISNAQVDDSMFQSALVYTTNIKKIEGIPLKRFRETRAYYYCLFPEESYPKLENFLGNYAADIDSSSSDEEEESQTQLNPGQCQTSSLDVLVSQILDSDIVCFPFGAGISSGYIPTLLDLFKGWGLEKVTSKDCATKESLICFTGKLINAPKETLGMVRKDYMNVFAHKIESTPAHHALKQLIDILKDAGKAVYIYTDNVDGIDVRVGIQKSYKHMDGYTVRTDLPQLNQRKTTVVVCGLSFDFDNILSTLYTRRADAQRISFFSLNVNPNNIAIMDGWDSDKMYDQYFSKGESAPPIKYNSPIAEMLCVPGSLQDALPALFNLTKERLNQ